MCRCHFCVTFSFCSFYFFVKCDCCQSEPNKKNSIDWFPKMCTKKTNRLCMHCIWELQPTIILMIRVAVFRMTQTAIHTYNWTKHQMQPCTITRKSNWKKKCTERPIKLQYLYIYWWPQAMETRNHHPSPMEPSTIAIIDDYYLSFTTQSSFYFETRRNNLINQSKIDFPQFILVSIQLHGQYREMNDFPWKRQRHG